MWFHICINFLYKKSQIMDIKKRIFREYLKPFSGINIEIMIVFCVSWQLAFVGRQRHNEACILF